VVTDVLDALGLFLIALGVATLVATALAPGWGLVAGGVVVLAGSALATYVQRSAPRGDQ
jgi:membrane protein implicated in regulation of membrane protease activity